MAQVGLILSGIALLSTSLWPATLLHAALDWNPGELGFLMLGEAGDTSLAH